MSLSAGTLIWLSCRPLMRLIICTGCGFIITKADIFPDAAARGAGQIMLNIALPALMFSKIVPAFTSDNISALGPLTLVAFLYEAIGILIAWIIGQFFWVPHRFRYGILVAGGWGNYGDIPTSVIMSLTGSAPFNSATDQNLAVAYISAFILIFMITLFPLGGHHWIAMDFAGPEVEHDEVREAMRRKRRAMLRDYPAKVSQMLRWRKPNDGAKGEEEQHEYKESISPDDRCISLNKTQSIHDTSPTLTQVNAGSERPMSSRINSPDITDTVVESVWAARPLVDSQKIIPPLDRPHASQTSPSRILFHPLGKWWHKLLIGSFALVKSLLKPASLAIIIAFPIAVVPSLKALFVVVPGVKMHPGPDGQPPLSLLLDTAAFIGGASVPLGLICLGSALARLRVPRNQWGSLPLGAITSLAVGKLFVMPVLGVLICQGLVRAGVIPKEDKVLQFVCMFIFLVLPTATTQVFLTQVYSGTGNAEHLPAFLIPQYIFMLVSMTALTAYALQMLF
ncbi:auxin efflux carrier transmembrane protein [Infundibulicybe gibba]|nr:auxin efflux carrier transmembrane protein [Infundibulicybe gibba]